MRSPAHAFWRRRRADGLKFRHGRKAKKRSDFRKFRGTWPPARGYVLISGELRTAIKPMKTRHVTPRLFRKSGSRMKLIDKPVSKTSKRASAVLSRILVPTDFSEASLSGLRYAVRLARPFDASIHLVYVLERPTVVPEAHNTPLVLPEAKLARIGRVRLASLGDAEINNSLPLKLHVCFGHPAGKIVTLARQLNADLIVMATHGRTSMSRVLLGITTDQVVRRADCPVLVVHEQVKPANTRRRSATEHLSQ